MMMEALTTATNEAVRKAFEHLGEILEPYQLARLKMTCVTILCVDDKDPALQYLVLFGPPTQFYIVEITTGRLVSGYKGFHLHVAKRDQQGVPTITIDYLDNGGEHVGS